MGRLNSGRVKWFNEAQGYGFIQMEDGRDVFVHYSKIAMDGFKTLRPDSEVEFDLYEGPKGLEAHAVKSKTP
jgi:CspA family cold shock protein